MRDRLVEIRVEHLALGVDGREPGFQQGSHELVVDELKALDDRLVRLVGSGVAQAALEVVHDRQDLKQKSALARAAISFWSRSVRLRKLS